MPRFYTYSFEDTDLTIQHPSYGSFSAYGTGLGDITISYANDVTMHDVSADAAVVVSKSVKKNGCALAVKALSKTIEFPELEEVEKVRKATEGLSKESE